MKSPLAEHLQNHRKPARSPCDGDSEISLGLGEAQDVDAVDVHTGAGLAQEKLPAVDFADMGDQLGLDSPRLREEKRQTSK